MDQGRTMSLTELIAIQADAAVHFVCLGCGASLNVKATEAIGRLEARGLGDGDTLIGDLGSLAERPCHCCAGQRWRTRALIAPSAVATHVPQDAPAMMSRERG